MTVYSPLRYPGGKAKLSPFIEKLMKTNLLIDGSYVEPYAGGAGVALSLLMRECASKIIINVNSR
jgi:DNA adenine methylase